MKHEKSKQGKAKKEQELAIRVDNVSKTFAIPHEKVDSVRGLFTGAFKKRTFERFDALKDVSFDVKKGEFFGIIGRNGSGKSTLLKILAGIYHPDKGRVKINGMISPFLELGIGFNPELSGRDNIYLNATVLGLTREQIDEKFDSIVEFSELGRFIDQKLKNYSSGMHVRLAFSVSIHANRDILLMDEVLAVGDSNFQHKCIEEFEKYKKQGRTVVIVSHNIGVVQKYCDRALLLRYGDVQMLGNPKKVCKHYLEQNMTDEERQEAKKREKEEKAVKKQEEDARKKREEKKRQKEEKKQEEDKDFSLVKNRNGSHEIWIREVTFLEKKEFFNPLQTVKGEIILQIKEDEIFNDLSDVLFSIGVYNDRKILLQTEKRILRKEECHKFYVKIPFKVDLSKFSSKVFRFSFDLRNRKDAGKVYDHWAQGNEIQVASQREEYPGAYNGKSIFYQKKAIIGLIRMRNEALILKDTLDHFSKIVDGIIIYDDVSEDESVQIARRHPSVLEVIEGRDWIENRKAEETRHRQLLLESVQKYNPDWIFYSDCDERFEGNIRNFLLSSESGSVDAIRIQLFDAYMTKNDKDAYMKGDNLYNFRKYFGPERRDILMIWKNKKDVEFIGLDKREPKIEGNVITKFYCQHYGKSLSVEHWEETCDYYVNNFPEPYTTKWKNRKGKAIHKKSDFDRDLYFWKDVKNNSIKI